MDSFHFVCLCIHFLRFYQSEYFPNITNVAITVECEEVSDDYCIFNVTDQLLCEEGKLPGGTTIDYEGFLYLILSSCFVMIFKKK